VQADQLLAQVETSKALLDIHSPADGFVRYEHQLGSELAIGSPICYITSAVDTPLPRSSRPIATARVGEASAKTVPTRTTSEKRPRHDTAEAGTFSPRFSRSAARLLSQRNLNPRQFAHLPLVRAQDVLSHIESADEIDYLVTEAVPAGDLFPPAFASAVPMRWESLSRRKLGEIRRLRSAQGHALASSVTVSCPTRGLRSLLRSSGGAVSSPIPFIVFEAARLLKKYPAFNAVFADGRAGYYEEVNVGVAIDYSQGLLVPVVRNADRKDAIEIVEELRELMYKYLRQELKAEDLSGGTFVVSDLSAEGVVSFLPLINQGQSAILGIGSEQFPVADAPGSFNFILTFDHQLAEGRMAAQFVNELAERVQARETSLRSQTEVTQEQENTNK
jgi:pyruvate/2-oxoglutarate dehydrogenase complex dihydrolipoamide acyltransferase (E2) component